MEISLNEKDELVIKLLHYFITERNYKPIVIHGVKNEIWLENLDDEYKIVRIVSYYIHNDEQLDSDMYKTKKIANKIRKKTLSLKVNVLNIFIDLGSNVSIKEFNNDMDCLNINNVSDFKKYNKICTIFPNIDKIKFKEEGARLFFKLTDEINKKTEIDAKKVDDIFTIKRPIITYGLILINILMFCLMYIFGNGSNDSSTLLTFGANYGPLVVEHHEYYRLFTSMFLHIGLAHLIFNMYALYVLGRQMESFLGKTKYLIIYILSGIIGNIFSLAFNFEYLKAGASGAIFGLLGALLYFGYHYRVYLGNVLKSQIIPLIILNLFIGLIDSGIDLAAHIGGLVVGILSSMALGIKDKSKTNDIVNGIIMLIIFAIFSYYLSFIRVK